MKISKYLIQVLLVAVFKHEGIRSLMTMSQENQVWEV